jgi:uncharacterized membrane protein YebE (DUF533 family)
MENLFDPTQLGLNHVQVIVRGMIAVAQSDEVHATELVLVREFYDACRAETDGLADFEDVVGQPLDRTQMVDVLDTPELRRIFLQSCLFLAYADGTYSSAERRLIAELAGHLGVPEGELDELDERIRDLLLRQIAAINNVDALRVVAEELKGEG